MSTSDAAVPVAPAAAAPAPAAATAASAPVSSAVRSVAAPIAQAAETTKNAMAAVATSAKSFFESHAKVFIGLLIVAAVGLILAYLLYSYVSTNLADRKAYLILETQIPISGLELTSCNGGGIPPMTNGRRLSMTFWIYLHDLNRNAGMYRHVFHRGDKAVQGSSPMVFLDKDSNKLHIRFDGETPTQNITMSAPWGSTTNDGNTDNDKLIKDLATHGITIPYIPLQRWVHVAVVLNENVNAGSITYYIDAELVASVASGTLAPYSTATGSASATTEFKALNLSRKGDIWIGGSPYEDAGPGFSGFVSRIQFYNYDINSKDVYDNYMAGPVSNLSSKLGMPAYGVRSPVYRIGA